MAEIRETEVEVERDPDGRVISQTERIQERPARRKGGGFGWGMLFGVVVIAGLIIAFALSRGSFEQAGADADRAAAVSAAATQDAATDAQQAIGGAAENAGQALEQAGQNAQADAQDSKESAPQN